MTFRHRHFCLDFPSFLRVYWLEKTLLDHHCMVKSGKMMEMMENHDNLVAVVKMAFTNVLSHKML